MGKTKGKGSRLKHDNIVPFLEPLEALQRLIEHFDNQGVINGGVAGDSLAF